MPLTPDSPAHRADAAPSAAPAPDFPSPQETRSLHRHAGWKLRWAGDEITEITRDGVVLLESLRPALRDPDWNAIPADIVDTAWSEGERALCRTQELRYPGEPAGIRARTELEITARMLPYRFSLTPEADLRTNRVGLTAMLPRTVAGLDGLLRTPDDAVRPFRFPRLISPFQPAFDIRSLEFGQGGVRARLDLDGDVFEMEDQRNWTDSSFKIYSRPLALPFPYLVRAGETVEQEVTLTLLSAPGTPRSAGHSGPVSSSTGIGTPQGAGASPEVGPVRDVGTLLAGAPRSALPALGVGATTQYSTAVTGPLPGLDGLSHLLVETCDGFGQEQVLGSAAREAAALGVPVDLRITATETTDLDGILEVADQVGLPLVRLGVVDPARHVTTGPLWDGLRRAASDGELELVAGARSHFTEFNREIHEIPVDADAVTFPSTPQMHMREPWHVVSSIAALDDVLATAAALRPDHPLHLGPVTLRPRVNAVATRPELVDRSDSTGYGAHLVPGAGDPHQHSTWAGAWAAAVILRAAVAGAASVTIAELAGARGLLGPDGRLAPIGEVLAVLAPLAGRDARIVCDVAGSGTALARFDDRLLVVNARLEDWELDLGGILPGDPPSAAATTIAAPPVAAPPADPALVDPAPLRVPAGTWRMLTVPAARRTP